MIENDKEQIFFDRFEDIYKMSFRFVLVYLFVKF